MKKITCTFSKAILILIIAFTMPFSLALPEQTKIYVDPSKIIDEGISPIPTYDIYYLSDTSLTGFGTDYRKLVTTTGTPDTTTSVKNAKNTGNFFFKPFTTVSTTTGTPSNTVLKGYGWRSDGVYGKKIPPGTWQFNLTLTSSSDTGTGHIEIWVYKCTTAGGSVSKLFSIDATGTNVLATTTATKYTFTYWASKAYDLTNYVLVIEYWLNVTAAGSSSTGNVALTAVSADSSVRPPPTGQYITTDIMVANVTDLFAWQVKIYYNATILNATEVLLPPNHVFADPTKYWYQTVTPVINNTEGYVKFGVTLIWVDPLTTFDGTGVLCRISFHVKDRGATTLHFSSPYGEDTFLENRYGDLISASTEDGFFSNKIPGDIDGDGDVDGTDFWMFAGVYPSDPALDPMCDLDWDGDVDGTDFWIFAGHYPTT